MLNKHWSGAGYIPCHSVNIFQIWVNKQNGSGPEFGRHVLWSELGELDYHTMVGMFVFSGNL
jgi:hypothetical protein